MLGGAEKQLIILVREQIKNGLSVTVIFLKGEDELVDILNRSGAKVVSEIANQNPVIQLFKLARFLQFNGKQISIIHAHLPRAQILSALAVRRSQKLICSRHDEDQFFPNGRKFISKFLFKVVDKKTTKWVAISDSVKKTLEIHGEITASSRVEVAHYGITPISELEVPSGSVIPLRVNESLVIGCVARLVHQKDHKTLLRGFAQFSTKFADAKLMIVGDGPLMGTLQRMAREIKISEKVIWCGRVTDVNTYFQQMDIFVLASTTEGFGLVLLEAMQNGVAVIGANNSAIPEVIGNAGLLFEPGNPSDLALKLEDLSNPEMRHRLSNAGVQRLAFFTPEIMEKRIRRIYMEAGVKL